MSYEIVEEKDIEIAYENVLGANNEFMKLANEYGRKDAILSIILYTCVIMELLLVGKLFQLKGNEITESYIFIASGCYAMLSIGLVFLFCILRRQKLSTIGLSKTQAKKSFILGIKLFALVVIFSIVRTMITGYIIQTNIILIVIRMIYFLIFVAFMEELVFRAYIGTRLYGFFKNKKLSIIIVGIMCSLAHVPFYMLISQVSLTENILGNLYNLIIMTLIHILNQWLYAKYNSIIAPTILHFIWDYAQWFII